MGAKFWIDQEALTQRMSNLSPIERAANQTGTATWAPVDRLLVGSIALAAAAVDSFTSRPSSTTAI